MPSLLSTLGSLLALSFGLLPVHAQVSSPPAAAKSDHTQEASVVELMSTKISFENDGALNQEAIARVHIQSEAGVQRYGLLTFSYQGSAQTVELEYVRVRKPDGTIVVTPPDNIQDLDAGITRAAPFYSDLREKHVAVRGLSPGDTIEYQARWRTTKPLVPGQFWYEYDFEHQAIVLDERLQISVPRDRPVKMKSSQIAPVITEENGRRVYAWRTSNTEDHSKENDSKALDATLGRLPPPEVQLSSFQSWDEVGQWYAGLQRDRVQPTPEILAKAGELTRGAANSTAALHTVYDYVSTKFRYIGVAFGIGRYQPHSAADVLGNQYGDCKDKHTLLASLLQADGITAYPALINSGHRLDPDVPSPGQFDHVISVVPQGKDFLWLDTTTEVGPFGYLIAPLRDKQALVIPRDKPAMLLTTPADLPFPNTQTFKIDGKLSDDGTLDAKVENTVKGDVEVLLRAAFRQVPQGQWKDLAQQISYSMGFAGTVSDTSASSPELTSEPFHYSYTYNRKDYPDWSEHRITVPGPPFSLPSVKDDDKSKEPIWLGPSLEIVLDSKFELPKGYGPELPSDVVVVRDYAEYRALYKVDRDALVTERRMVIKLKQVPSGEREDYKNFIKSVQEDVNRYVVLVSASAGAEVAKQDPLNASIFAALRSLPDSASPEALRLEKESLSAMQRNEQPAALDALRQAVAADPKFTRGWITLGSMYMASSQSAAGLDALRKAIDSDPKQPIAYKALASTLLFLRRTDDAIKVWQDLLKVAPEDRDAITNLGRLLYQQKRYSEAVPMLESEVRGNPSSAGPLSRLGMAYLRAGEVEKGFTTMQDVLKLDSGPGSLNNIAYELADVSVKLPEALGYAERAVREQEDASQTLTLSHLKVEDLQGTQRIGSYWDTLGWAHFRLGQLDQAEKYIRASWLLTQNPVVADHLGQVYEQQRKREAAIQTYRLALAALDFGANAEEIQAHLSRLLPGTNLNTGFDLHRGGSAGEELSRIRTVKLPRIVPGSASAEYFLAFGPGAKLEDVKFISGSDKLKPAEKVIRGAVFPVSYPQGSMAHIVRCAIVSCSSYTGCAIVLYNPDTVHSVD